MRRKLIQTLCISSLITATSDLANAEEIQLDQKLQRYHDILKKRPSSSALFQRFQNSWLAEHDETSLEQYLKDATKSGDAADHQIYAYYLLQKGQEKEAMEAFTKTLEIDKGNVDAWLNRSSCYAKLFDYDNAIKDVEKAIELSNDSEQKLQANKLKGRYLLRSGQTEAAAKHWTNLAENNRDDQDLLEDVIDIQLSDGMLEAALKLATELRDQTKDPYKRALRTLRIGDILQRTGQRDKAVSTYLGTLDLAGNGSWLEREIIAQLDKLYRREDNISGLNKTFADLREKYPQRSLIHQKHAELLASQSEFAKAKEIYQSLLKSSPGDIPLRVAYLNMLKQAGEFKEANKLLEFLIEQNPANGQLHLQKASILSELDDRQALLKSLQSYKKVIQPSAATAMKYAELLAKYRFLDEAKLAYKQAMSDYPDSTEVAFARANFLKLNDAEQEAIEIWKHIADSGDHDSLLRLIDTLQTNGKIDIAYTITKQWHSKYRTDNAFLKTACKVAEANNDTKQAVSWSRDLVLLSKNASELDQALSICTRLITKSRLHEEVLKDLTEKSEPSIAEKCLLAELLDQTGQQKLADKALEELSQTKDTIALLQAARIYQRRFQFDKAATALETLTKTPDGAKSAFLRNLTSLYERAGLVDKALETITRWKTIAPNDKGAWLMEVELLVSSKGPEAALNSMRRGLERFDNQPDILGLMADLYSQAGRNGQAMQLYWRLYDDAPNLSDRIRWSGMLAQSALNSASTEALIDELNTRRRRNPKSVAPIMALAEVYRVMNYYEERRNLLLEATRLRPDDAQLLIEIAIIDEREGKPLRAIELLTKASNQDKTGEASRRLAKLYMEEGDFERGFEELSKLHNAKADPRACETITLALLQQEGFEEARTYLQKQRTHFPKDWRLSILAATVDYELGYLESSFEIILPVLTAEIDMPKGTSGWDQASLGGMTGGMDMRGLPQDAQQMIYAGVVYQYMQSLSGHNSRNSYSFYSNNSSSQPASNLPLTASGAQLVAKLHIARLLEEMDANKATSLLARAEQAGLKHVKLWQQFIKTNNAYSVLQGNFIKEALKEDPKNKSLLTLLILSHLSDGELELESAEYKLIQESFSSDQSNPFVTEMLPFFMEKGADAEAHKKQLLKSLLATEKISETQLMGLINSYRHEIESMMRGSDEKLKMDADAIKILSNWLDQQPKAGQNQSNPTAQRSTIRYSYFIEMIVTQSILSGDDMDKIIELIEKDSTPGGSAFSARQFQRSMQRSMYGQKELGKLPSLPDLSLQSLNETQVSLFSSEEGSPIDAEKFSPHIGKLKSPLLRTFASRYCGDDKSFIKYLDEALESEEEKADALLIKAALLADKNENTLEAIQLVEQARTLSRNRQQRQAIDSYLLALGERAVEEGADVKSDTMEHARAAARRILITRQVQDKDAIKNLLTSLGMEDESARFLNNTGIAKHQSANQLQGGFAGINRVQQQRQQQKDIHKQIAEAVSSSNTQRADRLLYSSFKSLARDANNNEYELERLVKTAKKHNLTKNLIKRLHPGNSTSPRRWLTYYQAAQILENKEAKEEAIKYLSNLSSIPSSVKAPLAFALFEKAPERAMKLMLSSRDKDAIFKEFAAKVENTENFTESLSILEFAAKYLDQIEDEEFARDITHSQYYDNFFRYLLYNNRFRNGGKDTTPEYWKTTKKQENDNKDLARRDRAFETILNKSLLYQGTSHTAFRVMHARMTFRQEDESALVDIAKKCLTPPPSNTYYSNYGGSSGNGYENSPDPLTYLVTKALKDNNPELIDEAFLTKAQKSQPYWGASLKALKEIAFADTKKCEELLAKSHENEALRESSNDVLEIVRLRKDHEKVLKSFHNNLLDQISKRFVEKKTGHSQGSSYQFAENLRKILPETLTYCIAHGMEDKVTNLLDDLAKAAIGSKKPSPELWIKDATNMQAMYTMENPAAVYALISQKLLASPSTINLCIRQSNKHQFPVHAFSSISSNFSSDEYEQPTVEDIKKAGFLTPLSELRIISTTPIPLETITKGAGKNSMLRHAHRFEENYRETTNNYLLLANLVAKRKHYSSHSKQYKQTIKDLNAIEGKEAFAAQMVATLCEDSTITSFRFIKKFEKEIRKAPKEQRLILSHIFNIQDDAQLRTMLANDKLDDLLPIDQESVKKKQEKEVSKFLELKSLGTNYSHYSFAKRVGELILPFYKENPELAAKVTMHAFNLVEHRSSNDSSSHIRSITNGQIFLHRYLVREHIGESNSFEPFYLAEYIRHLQMQPESYKLGLQQAINETSPYRWLSKLKTKDKKKLAAALVENARQVHALKDPKAIRFHKVFWLIQSSSRNAYRYISVHELKSALTMSSKDDPKHADYYDYLQMCCDLEVNYLEKVLEINTAKGNGRSPKHGNYWANSYCSRILNHVVSPDDLENTSMTMNHLGFSTPQSLLNFSPELRKAMVDTYLQASKNENFINSLETRYIASKLYRSPNLFKDSFGALSSAALKNIELHLEYIKNGGTIHQNHFISTCMLAGSTKEGADKVAAIIQRDITPFIGFTNIAECMLRHGHEDLAIAMLPKSKISAFTPTMSRSSFDKVLEPQFNAFIVKITDKQLQLKIAHEFLTMPDADWISTSADQTYPERLVRLAKLYKESKVSSDDQVGSAVLNTICESYYYPAIRIVADDIAKSAGNTNYTQILKTVSGLEYSSQKTKLKTQWAAHWQHSLDSQDPQTSISQIRALVTEYHAQPKYNYDYAVTIQEVLSSTSSYYMDLYTSGDREKLTAHLPILKEIIEIYAHSFAPPWLENKLNVRYNLLSDGFGALAFLIYDEMGHGEEYRKFLTTLPKQRLPLLKSFSSYRAAQWPVVMDDLKFQGLGNDNIRPINLIKYYQTAIKADACQEMTIQGIPRWGSLTYLQYYNILETNQILDIHKQLNYTDAKPLFKYQMLCDQAVLNAGVGNDEIAAEKIQQMFALEVEKNNSAYNWGLSNAAECALALKKPELVLKVLTPEYLEQNKENKFFHPKLSKYRERLEKLK
ncbi:beta-barrel assembly-enhancing protease [Rubritalea halochordaticola]|uniref:Beta-barrel assembly-enhancing protease n=1 Tax=Rubritalea halochordaticola TaxID=714537 RepID=A0ABP9V6Q2_9BACT